MFITKYCIFISVVTGAVFAKEVIRNKALVNVKNLDFAETHNIKTQKSKDNFIGQKLRKTTEKSHKSNNHADMKKYTGIGNNFNKSDYNKNDSKHSKDRNQSGHRSNFRKVGKSHKQAKFGEKKGYKKGHKTKGYHNKFHKDEYYKEHKFYDGYQGSGHHNNHGNAYSSYDKHSGGYQKGKNNKSSENGDLYHKNKYKNKVKNTDEDYVQNIRNGHDSYFQTLGNQGHSDNHFKGINYGFLI